jgi:hypothetical protein
MKKLRVMSKLEEKLEAEERLNKAKAKKYQMLMIDNLYH